MPDHKYSFPKHERLCNNRIIGQLYLSPNKMVCYPLSIHWMFVDNGSLPCRMQTLLVAPKRRLHLAVARNRTKRLMRECWRTRKGELLELLERNGTSMVVAFNYIGVAVPDFKTLEKAFSKATSRLLIHLNNEDAHD